MSLVLNHEGGDNATMLFREISECGVGQLSVCTDDLSSTH